MQDLLPGILDLWEVGHAPCISCQPASQVGKVRMGRLGLDRPGRVRLGWVWPGETMLDPVFGYAWLGSASQEQLGFARVRKVGESGKAKLGWINPTRMLFGNPNLAEEGSAKICKFAEIPIKTQGIWTHGPQIVFPDF